MYDPVHDKPRPRMWWDWVLAGLIMAAAVLEGTLRAGIPSPVVSVIVAVGLAPTVLWRRTRPLLMVGIAFGVCMVVPLVLGAESDLNTMVFLLLLVYSLFRWGSGRDTTIGAGIIVAKLGISTATGHMSLVELGGGFVILFSVSAVGAALRFRAKARMRELDQVKLLERERLARDLHDTVAHHVSAMAIRAGAGLAAAETSPDAATEALSVIESEASLALTEMRTMVRVLRQNEPAELAPSPRIGDLEDLVRSGPGPKVDVEITGPIDDLPPSVATAIYRLAQESVTNARRHAHRATRIEVRVKADETSVQLRVTDDGDASPATSPGHGLVGMMERADLLGGTCEAGPNADRGWTVTAVLPRSGAAR
ncbi:signal transduction histidine kinase [Kibdelosporangium banguiense]|uniref:histidine kinase n=1 Tax=Kibdelosporangium banguiense TaxID=1365924 RepID=A0ABS4TIV5_9PSEU|nr:sensor histidine kinase [Kibdelosporangium banguiense]MBP2324361.1 signal transduction histidine kinase [Kibdelosporangium banguiense]